MHINYVRMYNSLLDGISSSMKERPNDTLYGCSAGQLIKSFLTVSVGGPRHTGKTEDALGLAMDHPDVAFICRDERQKAVVRRWLDYKGEGSTKKQVYADTPDLDDVNKYSIFIVDDSDSCTNYQQLVEKLVQEHKKISQLKILRIL